MPNRSKPARRERRDSKRRRVTRRYIVPMALDEDERAAAVCDALLANNLAALTAAGAPLSGEVWANTPKELAREDPNLELVIQLAHCACVSKAWRKAVLRRMVRVLSPPFDVWSRAAAASALVAYSSEEEALALVEANGIAPLFALAQAAPRRQDLTPSPSAHPATLACCDHGITALAMVARIAGEQLTAAGWTLLDPDEVRKERGITEVTKALNTEEVLPVYEHNETGHITQTNPLLGSGNDAKELLTELPMLLSPQWILKEKRVRWPATIRHHRCAEGFSPPVDEDLTVLDEYIPAPPGEDGGPPGEELRQLVMGAWGGLTGFRETEWNLAEAAGENLFAWYSTAMAAVVALRVGTQQQKKKKKRRPRLLLIGLGGGSMATFFAHHYGSSMEIDCVERSAPCVYAAENFFGLREHEADDPEDASGEADAVISC